MSDFLYDDSGEEREHAILAPSSAHRWIPCPGSVFAEAGEDDRSTPYAREGGAAHQVASAALTERLPGGAGAYVGRLFDVDGKSVEVTEEMAADVQIYVDKVNELLAAAGEGAILLVEQKLDFSRFIDVPDQWGRGDAIILDFNAREIIVDDLKFGKGVRVDVEDNPQLKLYGLGALDLVRMVTDFYFERVRLVVHQVRLGAYQEWVISVPQLTAWAATEAKFAAQRAMKMYRGEIPPVYVAGEKQCRFCRFAASCPEAAKLAYRAAIRDFEPVTGEPVLNAVSDKIEALAANAKLVPFVKAWANAVMEKLEYVAIQVGEHVPGFKVVRGKRGDRQWSDPAMVASALSAHDEADVYEPRKLRSPAQMEKVKGLKNSSALNFVMDSYVSQSEGRLTVVPESDSRDAVAVSPTSSDFVNVDTTEMF